MRTPIKKIVVAGLLLSALPLVARTRPRSATHASLKHGASASKLHKSVRSSRSTAGMSSDRATEIQSALIGKGYLSGEPSGAWDAQTSAAMSRFQADNGWQSKITPDARGLIKLGLGPDNTAATSSSPK